MGRTVCGTGHDGDELEWGWMVMGTNLPPCSCLISMSLAPL